MTRLPVEKVEVDFDGSIVRGVFERYPDKIKIYVRKNQTKLEQRFTVVKEMCQGLADEESDYSPDGVETIRQLVKYRSIALDGKASEQVRSERFAEFLALELIYPVEYRTGDRKAIYEDQSATIAEIADKRGVPPVWIVAALEPDFLAFCQQAWQVVSENVKFDPLKPLQ